MIGRLSLLVAAAMLAGLPLSPGAARADPLVPYYRLEDAPKAALRTGRDPRLCLTRASGDGLADAMLRLPSVATTLSTPEFTAAFARRARPLDLIATRSSSPALRMAVPSHFTHVAIWLGTRRQIEAEGLWNAPELARLRPAILRGETVVEAIHPRVGTSTPQAALAQSEVALLRLSAGPAGKRAIYRRIARLLGTRFDTSFDLSDGTRLSCIEFVARAMPFLPIPVRYAAGRLALIPDDLVRLAVQGGGPLRLAGHWVAAPGGRVAQWPAARTRARLSRPSRPPRLPLY